MKQTQGDPQGWYYRTAPSAWLVWEQSPVLQPRAQPSSPYGGTRCPVSEAQGPRVQADSGILTVITNRPCWTLCWRITCQVIQLLEKQKTGTVVSFNFNTTHVTATKAAGGTRAITPALCGSAAHQLHTSVRWDHRNSTTTKLTAQDTKSLLKSTQLIWCTHQLPLLGFLTLRSHNPH